MSQKIQGKRAKKKKTIGTKVGLARALSKLEIDVDRKVRNDWGGSVSSNIALPTGSRERLPLIFVLDKLREEMPGACGSGRDLGNSLWHPWSNNEVARRCGDRNKLRRLIMAGINYSILELSRVQETRGLSLFLQRDVFKDTGRIYASAELHNILQIAQLTRRTVVKINIFENNIFRDSIWTRTLL